MIDDTPRPAANQGEEIAWQESDSAMFLEFGQVFTPARHEIERVLIDLVPAQQDEPFLCVEIGVGQGWLSKAVLDHFRAAKVIALDGSQTMLRHAGAVLAPFADRVELREFRLEARDWHAALEHDVRCFVSSLVIHHLDGPAKRELYADLYRHLAPGGALLIMDLVAPTSEIERRYIAQAWNEEIRRQSLELLGDLRAYDVFTQNRWNIYEYPDPTDIPSSIPDHLRWLEEAGFMGASVFWARTGHAVYGGYKPSG